MLTPASTPSEIKIRQERPAKKITEKPAASTNNAVPKSGCRWIKITGTKSMTAAITKSRQLNAPSRFWKYQANIKGVAIFINSDG